VLKTAGGPIGAGEVSTRAGIPAQRARAELFRLMGEGKVECKQVGGQLLWALKLGTPTEERYEKLAKKLTP